MYNILGDFSNDELSTGRRSSSELSLFVGAGMGGNWNQPGDSPVPRSPPDPMTANIYSLLVSQLRATVLEAHEQLEEAHILLDATHLQLEESQVSNEMVRKLADAEGSQHGRKLGWLDGKEATWDSDMSAKRALAECSHHQLLHMKHVLDGGAGLAALRPSGDNEESSSNNGSC